MRTEIHRALATLCVSSVLACGPKVGDGRTGGGNPDDGDAGSPGNSAGDEVGTVGGGVEGGSGLDGGSVGDDSDSVGGASDGSGGGEDLPPEVLWVRTYDGETHNRDVGFCVAAPDDDTLIVGGLEVLDCCGGSARSWLARLDGSGDTVWLAHEMGSLEEAVAVSASERVLAAGLGPAQNGYLMALGSYVDGTGEWIVGERGASAHGVALIGEDAVVVGTTQDPDAQAWISRRDPLGGEVFTVWGDAGTSAIDVAADSDSVFVVGATLDGGDILAAQLWLYGASDGAPLADPVEFPGLIPLAGDRDDNGPVLLAVGNGGLTLGRVAGDAFAWSDTFGDPQVLQFEWDVTLDAAGNVVVAGGQDMAQLRKYSPDGDLLWTREYAYGVRLVVNGVAATPSGDIVVVGSVDDPDTDTDIWVSRWIP